METVIILNAALPLPVDGRAPEFVQLTPAGRFNGRDGRGPFVVDPAAVVAAAQGTLPLVIDEMHATDLQGPSGGAAPARGWITELQAREDGVWGRVDWTPEGNTLVVNRSYRGISPALSSDKATGRVHRVLRAGLTNVPNFTMTTLHNQESTRMELDLGRLRTALGLGADASFDQCCEMAASRTTAHAADTAVARAEAARMANEIVSLNTQLGALREGQARDRATAAIDAAIRDGKPITALRDHYITRHMANPADVELELQAMVSLHAGGVGPRQLGKDGKPQATAQDVEVAGRMGLTPDQLTKAREQREAARGAH